MSAFIRRVSKHS